MKKFRLMFVILIGLVLLSSCNISLFSKEYNVDFYIEDELYYSSIVSNNTIPMPDDPVKNGYDFAGWYLDQDNWSTVLSFSNIKNSYLDRVNVYAKFQKQYNVFFDTNGGSNVSTKITSKIDESVISTKESHVLLGWYFDESFTEKASFPLEITQDITLHAKWAQTTMTIIFCMDDEEPISTQTINYGDQIVFPESISKTGNDFIGWYDSNQIKYDENSEILASITLYAKYVPSSYKITFDYNGANPTVLSSNITYGGSIQELPNVSYQGYDFIGWYFNDIQINNGDIYNYTQNITLVARYNIKHFTIRFFDINDIEIDDSSISVPYDTTINELSFPSVEDKAGYTHKWLEDDMYVISLSYKIRSDVNLYLTYVPNTYYITYIYDELETITRKVYIQYGQSINLLDGEKYGYNFLGWFYNETQINQGDTYNFLTSIRLKAKYSIKIFDINFYDTCDELIGTKKVEYLSELIDILPVPEITGYTGEWFVYNMQDDMYYLADFTSILGNMDVYVLYTPNIYQATYMVFTQEYEVIDQTFDEYIILPDSIPTVQDYYFAGWYYGDTKISSNMIYNIAQDIEITARMVSYILDAPILAYNANENKLEWNIVDNAEYYDIYCNDKVIARVASNTNYYDLSAYTVGVFEFKVVSIGNQTYGDSSYSDSIIVKKETTENSIILNEDAFVYNEIASINVKMDKKARVLSWDPQSNIEYYVICIYDNYDISYYSTIYNNICFDDIVSDQDISAIRIGMVYTNNIDAVYISFDLWYYNPIVIADFNNEVYIFDGYIGDRYITSTDELSNIAYYSYIYRDSECDIVFSNEYIDTITALYNDTEFNAIGNAINVAINSYFETSYCSISYQVSRKSDGLYYATIMYNYYGVTECSVNIPISNKYYYQQDKYDAYYETFVGTKRSPNYDNYVSDDKFLCTVVETSEELYWAIENGYTPLFTSTTSRAYIIYIKAKETLNSIIYEEMTDYEKTLSIFDWISLNTVYNYTPSAWYQVNGYGNGYTTLPSYYLEGVFLTHYSVCDGFSKAFSLMCNMEGIECIRIVGHATSNGDFSQAGGHAWNKVIIDNKCYIVDITWTETIRQKTTENLTHEYFMISDESISSTHRAYENRVKFHLDKYRATNNYRTYFANTSYTYKTQKYDYVIESDEELISIFDFVLDNSRETIEIILDYDYLVSMCGTDITLSGSQTSIALDQFIEEYLIAKFKASKFSTQYVELTCANDFITYLDDGSIGLIYVFEFYMMIDSLEDIETMFLDRDGSGCKYDFVITISLLIDGGYAYISESSLLPTVGYDSLLSAIQSFISDNLPEGRNVEYVLENGYYMDTYCYFDITF